MLTIVFYATQGAAAKLRSRELVAARKGDYARVYDIAVWDGSKDKCDAVQIMPDVQSWQRKRIIEVYGDIVTQLEYAEEEHEVQPERPELKSMELFPNKETKVENEKKAVHKGGGRWFVMVGEERISGPHDKAEAVRLAAIDDSVTA